MAAPQYDSFAAVALLVLGLLVVLARASGAMFYRGEEQDPDEGGSASADDGIPATGAARIERHVDAGRSDPERRGPDADDEETWSEDAETPWGEDPSEADARASGGDPLSFSTGGLLANVALSQGVFGAALVAAAWVAGIPATALGVDPADPWSVGLPAVGAGVALGVVLYLANELSAGLVDAAGVDYSEGLRAALAPDTPGGWVVLLGVVLPVIAAFEELLFRAALVGALAAGFGVSPWLLAVGSTVAFAVGHGAQGPGGVAVTGLLGFGLAAAFVLTGSLLAVVVAHYLVNALEFVVHEGVGVEWI